MNLSQNILLLLEIPQFGQFFAQHAVAELFASFARVQHSCLLEEIPFS